MVAGGDEPAVVEYARYLGIEPHEDAALIHIAREAVVAELPHGWEEHTDDDGNVFYFNEKEDRSMWEHPSDAHYRKLVVKTRQDITADRPSKAAPDDKKYLNAIGSSEARMWWAENIGRKRVRTRQVAKLLAAWLVEHHTLTEKASPLGAATSDVDEIITSSSTTREYARTIVTAMEKEEGRLSAEDFGTFIADKLKGNFTAASLRSLARQLQPRRTAGAKRRQQTSPVNGSIGQGAHNHATHGNTQGTDAGMRAFETSRDSRASAVRCTRTCTNVPVGQMLWIVMSWPTVRPSGRFRHRCLLSDVVSYGQVLERQRTSPTAAKYAAVTAGGSYDPNAAARMASPVVPTIHRELLAPLTGSENEPLSANSMVGRSRGARIGGHVGLTAPGVTSGSPVRLPSLESSPVPMNTSDLDGPDVNQLAGWGGNLTGSGGMTAGRWPARHKFSMKRTRQRSEKLQPVAAGAAGSGAPSVGATGAAAARGELGISDIDSVIDSNDHVDSGGRDSSFEQAW